MSTCIVLYEREREKKKILINKQCFILVFMPSSKFYNGGSMDGGVQRGCRTRRATIAHSFCTEWLVGGRCALKLRSPSSSTDRRTTGQGSRSTNVPPWRLRSHHLLFFFFFMQTCTQGALAANWRRGASDPWPSGDFQNVSHRLEFIPRSDPGRKE